MLQTNPSGPSLGALSLDNASKSGAEREVGNGEEFSQEYDKQVKKVGTQGPANGPRKTEASADKEKAEAAEPSDESSVANDKLSTEETKAANDDEPGGNSLPLEQMRKMAAEIQLERDSTDEGEASAELPVVLDAEEPIVLDTEEPAMFDAEVSAIAVDDDEPLVDAQTETLDVIVEQPVAQASHAPVGEAVAAVVKELTPQPAAAAVDAPEEESEAPEFDVLKKGKEYDLPSLLSRQSGGERGAEAMPRGERGFETLLSGMPGRAGTAAASIDTLTPTIAPLAGQGASNPLAAPVPVAMTLAMPMQHANWGQAMAERVVWMSNANIQEAEIQLNPRELGPIGIKISVTNEQTHVSFVAQHAATRDALESAIPRLREMLSENGLQLGQSDVSQHSFKGQGEQGEAGSSHAQGGPLSEGDEELLGAEIMHGVGYAAPTGVDAFA